MNREMRLTVVIPGFRTPEAWWGRSVGSVLAAVDDRDEVICVDDGEGVAFLDGFCRGDGRIRVIHQRNGGPGDARNHGLACVRGAYVAFADSDDRVLREIYRRSLEALEKADGDVAMFGVRLLWGAEGVVREDVPHAMAGERMAPRDAMAFYANGLLNYVWNKVYRRDFLERHGIRFHSNGMPCEDVAFNIDCLTAGARWCLLPVVGYCYCRSRTSLLHRYVPTYEEGLQIERRSWLAYAGSDPEAGRVVNVRARRPVAEDHWECWRNLWMPGSPASVGACFRWLVARREEILAGPPCWRRRVLRLSAVLLTAVEACVQFFYRYGYGPRLRRCYLLWACPTARRMTREEREAIRS